MPVLQVTEVEMPETNGKTNYTAMLHRVGDFTSGITLAVSEYPDRVRYEADRMRYMLGVIEQEPCILDYDANKHSGYKGPKVWFTADEIKAAWLAGANLYQGCMGQCADPDEEDAEKYLKSIQE